MSNKRPRIQVLYQPVDIIIELVATSILLLLCIYTVFEYRNLPETVPTHFNSKGIADGFSDKSTLLIIPVIALVLYIGIFIINKYPHVHNYMVNINENNALKNYRFSTKTLRIVNLFTMLILAFVTYTITEGAKNNATSLGSWFIPVIIGLSILLPILIFIYYKKVNKQL